VDAAHESTRCHIYDEFNYPLVDQDGSHLWRHIETRETTYMVTALPLPDPPPQEYYAKDGESFQFIAYKFIKNPTLWWQIAEANPQVWYPLDLHMGSYIHVPST